MPLDGSLMSLSMNRTTFIACVLATVLSYGVAAAADPLAGSERWNPGYTPPVPVSALARPLAWFDPSRLQISTSVIMGSGFGAATSSQALQVTSFNYRFGLPLEVGVRVGNTWGTGFERNASSSFFLEGLDVRYRPTPNMSFEIHTRDVRSPLQYDSRGPWWR